MTAPAHYFCTRLALRFFATTARSDEAKDAKRRAAILDSLADVAEGREP